MPYRRRATLVNDATNGVTDADQNDASPLAQPGLAEPDFAAQLREDLGDADMRHVLTVFARDLEQMVPVITAAAAAGEAIRFRRTAHALAGAAGAVGANHLADACRKAMLDHSANAAAMLVQASDIDHAAGQARLALDRVRRHPAPDPHLAHQRA